MRYEVIFHFTIKPPEQTILHNRTLAMEVIMRAELFVKKKKNMRTLFDFEKISNIINYTAV